MFVLLKGLLTVQMKLLTVLCSLTLGYFIYCYSYLISKLYQMYLKFICNRMARMNPSFHNFHFVVFGHACFGMSFGGHLLLHFPMGPRFVNLLTCREYPYQVLLCFILFYSSFSGSDIISLEERSTLNRGCGNTVQVQECDC